jgi:hypothetical protein
MSSYQNKERDMATWREIMHANATKRVTTRERGVIPGCYPMDIHEYTTPEGGEVCAYPPKQGRSYTPKPSSSFMVQLVACPYCQEIQVGQKLNWRVGEDGT